MSLFSILLDYRPDNLKIKRKRRRLRQAGWSLAHQNRRARLLKNSSPLPKPNQNGIVFKRADPSHTAKGPVSWIRPSWILENILKSSWNHLEIILKSSWNHLESSLNHLGIILKSSWNHFEIILKSFWNHLEIILKSSWNHLEIFLKSSTFKRVDPSFIRPEDPSLKM